jgi:hypothetical protein
MKMAGKDLLGKVNEKLNGQASGESSEAPQGDAIVGNPKSTVDNNRRGDDLLKAAASKEEPEVRVETKVETPVETTVKDPDTWSKDSALKEVVKLREENKAVRTKFQEQLDKIKQEQAEAIAKIKEEAQSAYEAKKKLEAVEAEAADKKRSIEEKLADREAKLARTEEAYKRQLEEKEKEVASYKNKALQYEAEVEARREQYRDRIKEELAKVPDDLKEFADAIVKGKEDPQEGWLALAAARDKGLFGEKKVVVNHTVPGAGNGARLSKTKADEEAEAKNKKKTSRDLIRNGLSKIKQGESNSAFRSR